MQRLLLIWMLTILPLVSQAAESMIIPIPNTRVLSTDISMADDKVCQTQARVGAKALQNAHNGITLDEQLAMWDAFEAADMFDGLNKFELIENRRVTVLAWEVAEKHPSVTPDEYGDVIYDSCVNIKSVGKVRI